MKVYIVYSCYHYDDYKRAESSAEVCRVFTDEEKAYDFANNKLLLMFDDYANYNFSDLEDEDLFSKEHIISIINDKTKSKKEIYNWIQDNLYNNILCEPQYTMMPSHINYFVNSKIIDDEED